MKTKYLKCTLYALLTISLSCMLFACNNTPGEQTEPATDVNQDQVTLTEMQAKNAGIEVAEISENNVSSVLRLHGSIEVPPQNIISVSVPLGGYVKHFNLIAGSKVLKGQILATVEDQQYIQLQQDYLINKSKLSLAAKEEDRQKQLNQGKAGSDKALEIAVAEHTALRVSVHSLAEKLRLIGIDPQRLSENNITRQISVISPISGHVSKVNGNIGTYVNPSNILFELVNPDNIHLSLTVFEKDLDKVAIGQKAMAFSNNNPSKKYSTTVKVITRNLNADRSVEIHAEFDQKDKNLIPGMYMNAEMVLNAAKAKSLPDNSIVNFEGKPYVFVETDKNTFLMTPVAIGHSDNGYVPVYTDLIGKKIVVKGAYSLLMQLKNIVEED